MNSIAAALHNDCESPLALAQAREAIAAHRGNDVVVALLAIEKALHTSQDASLDEYRAFEAVMRRLEQIADVDTFVAGYFMAKLLAIAIHIVGMHDIPDAVGLWLIHLCSEELRAAFANELLVEEDPFMIEFYRQAVAEFAAKLGAA